MRNRRVVFFFIFLFVLLLAFFTGSGGYGLYIQKKDLVWEKALTLDIENITGDITLSPVVIIFHTDAISFDLEGTHISSTPYSDVFEHFVELGESTSFVNALLDTEGVLDVFTTQSDITPFARHILPLGSFTREQFQQQHISFLSKIIETNDGYIFATIPMEDLLLAIEANEKKKHIYPIFFDAGIEENNPVGTGFLGGQPEIIYREKNIENGLSTNDVVERGKQLKDQLTMFSIFW